MRQLKSPTLFIVSIWLIWWCEMTRKQKIEVVTLDLEAVVVFVIAVFVLAYLINGG